MSDRWILALDQGTTSTTVLLLDSSNFSIQGRMTVEVPQHFPAPGQVEHDPDVIWQGVLMAIDGALKSTGVANASERIGAIGITNQRETTVLWDRRTGQPVHRAIVWQDRRTAPHCQTLKAQGAERLVFEKAGLLLDPYFSGTKLRWLLDHVENARPRAERGELAFGTIDSWLIYKLSGGAVHCTDVTNASRTMMMDLRTLAWDETLLATLGVPDSVLPQIVGSAEVVATTKGIAGLRDGIVISGIAGDQQAALFGQGCYRSGDVKCTYGTGAFILMNIGDKPLPSRHRLLTTVAWKIADQTTYAMEGSSFIAGAAVQWLRDGLGIISHASEIEALARTVSDAGECVFVPALTGLGAPHWAPEARGLITGIGRDTTRAHLARATLDGIALSIADLVAAMESDAGEKVRSIRVDGGASANGLLMELQAALARAEVLRPAVLETTALGAGMLAAIGAGLCPSMDALPQLPISQRFDGAAMQGMDALQDRWRTAIRRTLLVAATSA
ncbi:MAG: glycerol kinase GlpK [Deltaproteobacteria bacterium]|nr:glycerol kinase GlpK [Deltaproteobacteria bacterium]